jgi:hypothetical protein
MYKTHLEWQRRIYPVAVASFTKQFRRYFDRFEGRIKEPSFAMYDDLAYTQGTPPEKSSSLMERDTVNPGGMVTGPNLNEHRERLRGFALDLGKEDDVMHVVFSAGEQQPSANFEDLYNFPILTEQRPPQTGNYSNTVEDMVFLNLDQFTIPEIQGYQTTTANAQILSPFDLGSIQTTSSHPSATTAAGASFSDEIPNLLFNEGFESWDDLFGDMPDLPGLDGVIDQGFLEFLDTQQ